MEDSLTEKFMGDGAERNNEGSTNFDELRGSLMDITDAWQSKQQSPAKSFTMVTPGEENRAQWRIDLGRSLESTPTHVFLVTLLLVDLLATAVDILTTIHNKTSDLNSCSVLLEGCQCVGHFERTESLEFIYWISIVILTILAANVLLLLVAFGTHFFRHPGYILDAFVVGTALGLEIFLDSDTVGLLIILTLWRIVRVAHGIFEMTDEAWENQIKGFEKRLSDAESKHDSDQELLQEKAKRIAELESALRGSRQQGDDYDYGRQQEDSTEYGRQQQDIEYQENY